MSPIPFFIVIGSGILAAALTAYHVGRFAATEAYTELRKKERAQQKRCAGPQRPTCRCTIDHYAGGATVGRGHE